MTKQPAAVCVIGGGIIGSWAALHLAEAGVSTTLIEQFPLPHTRGSSHGLSRAFRFLGELELGRLEYSLDRWQALEKASGETLFVKTGLLNFGPPGDPDLEKYLSVVADGGRLIDWLESEAIAARFPMLSYTDEWGAAWDAYDESPAADVEDSWSQMMDCPDSWLFEGFKIEGVETTPTP